MDDALLAAIVDLRRHIESDPASILYCSVNPALTLSEAASDVIALCDNEPCEQLVALHAEMDGGRFGIVDLFSFERIGETQFLASECEGGCDEWLIVGQIAYEPLALSRRCGTLTRHAPDSTVDLGTVNSFLTRFVFSEGYKTLLAGDADGWLGYVQRTGT